MKLSTALRMRVGLRTAGTLTASGGLNDQKSRSFAVTSRSAAPVATSGSSVTSGAPSAIQRVRVASSVASTGLTQASIKRAGGGI